MSLYPSTNLSLRGTDAHTRCGFFSAQWSIQTGRSLLPGSSGAGMGSSLSTLGLSIPMTIIRYFRTAKLSSRRIQKGNEEGVKMSRQKRTLLSRGDCAMVNNGYDKPTRGEKTTSKKIGCGQVQVTREKMDSRGKGLLDTGSAHIMPR